MPWNSKFIGKIWPNSIIVEHVRTESVQLPVALSNKKVSESTHHRVVNIFWHAQISKQHECCSILCFIAGSL